MTENETLSRHFQRSTDAICRLRAQDAELDEMCRDFLDLSSRAVAALTSKGDRALWHLADLAETMSGLSEEIETRLELGSGGEGQNRG